MLSRAIAAVLALLAALALLQPAHADPDYVELKLSKAHGHLEKSSGWYKFSEVGAQAGWRIDDWIEDKLHMNPPGEWNLIWEGYAGMVERPETNFEIGSALGLRVSHKLAGDLRMFIEGASGPFYTTQKLKEQATQFNFASYVDVGLEYRLGERHSLTVSQNLRHFSNADLDQPNDGVDTHGVEVGYIWYF